MRGTYNGALYLTPRYRMLRAWADLIHRMIADDPASGALPDAQSDEKRCGWDHPFDDRGRAACIVAAGPGYSKATRQAMDGLVSRVGR